MTPFTQKGIRRSVSLLIVAGFMGQPIFARTTPSPVPSFLTRCTGSLRNFFRGPANVESIMETLGSAVAPHFRNTKNNLRVDPVVRRQIQQMREDLLEESKKG